VEPGEVCPRRRYQGRQATQQRCSDTPPCPSGSSWRAPCRFMRMPLTKEGQQPSGRSPRGTRRPRCASPRSRPTHSRAVAWGSGSPCTRRCRASSIVGPTGCRAGLRWARQSPSSRPACPPGAASYGVGDCCRQPVRPGSVGAGSEPSSSPRVLRAPLHRSKPGQSSPSTCSCACSALMTFMAI
jgi:hypothetical protein